MSKRRQVSVLMSGYFRAASRLALLAALPAALGVGLSACNYGFRGGGGFPPHVRTIYIAPLENETIQFDLDQQIFRMMNERLPRSLGVRVAGERAADAVLRATVTGYEDAAQNYRPGQQAGSVEVVQHQVQIRMTIRIVDVRENVILFESTGITGRGEYRPDTQSDETARNRAIETLIQQIIDGAQSQW
jgi:outer membrane lipopolysaccharide assembly protein LptE/RlpB